MKYLVTGGAGFAGYHLIKKLLTHTDSFVYSMERPKPRRDPIESPRLQRLYHDFTAEIPESILRTLNEVDHIIHLGAEVQGRQSVENPVFFVRSNVLGTFNVLEMARKLQPQQVIYVSSAEAIGVAPEGVYWDETAQLHPSNPYAASKAAGEMLCYSYIASFKAPISVVRTMCLFGPRQTSDKFVPMLIKKLRANEEITIHAKDGVSGSRQYLPIDEFVDGLLEVLRRPAGMIYHLVGTKWDNEILAIVLREMMESDSIIRRIEPGPSHDMRYSLKDTLIRGFQKGDSTMAALYDTVCWYRENPSWL